jgi:1-acyl-sn-glycerol-3-phosphate acyltransferase
MIYIIRYGLIVVYTIFWGGLACTIGLLDRSGEFAVFVARQWVRWICFTCGIDVTASGLDAIDRDQPYVVMSNHQSVFDIVAIVSTLPISWRFVAKRELGWIPFFGWALHAGKHVIIDRGRRERSVRSLHAAAERVRAGTSAIIFPEGTRSPTGELREFKSGGFHLAMEAGVPILPASVSGSRWITPKGSLRIESGRIGIHYGTPIPTQGLDPEERTALKHRVRHAIAAGMDPALQQSPDTAPAAPPLTGRSTRLP